MTDRRQWEHEQLMEWRKEVIAKFENLEEWKRGQDEFKQTTILQLLTIVKRLEELQEGDKWIKRMFVTALVGTALSAVGGIIMWAIQN